MAPGYVAAPGLRLLGYLRRRRRPAEPAESLDGLSFETHKVLVAVLTFLSYTAYHMTRKPPSIVKDALHPASQTNNSNSAGAGHRIGAAAGVYHPMHGSNVTGWPAAGPAGAAAPAGVRGKPGDVWNGSTSPSSAATSNVAGNVHSASYGVPASGDQPVANGSGQRQGDGMEAEAESNKKRGGEGEGWPPFDGPNGAAMLGELDLAFLITYSFGLFFSGHLGDRLNLRLFLTAGMLLGAAAVAAFGAAYFLKIHSFWYFVGVQVLSGLFQSTGWPSVVAVMANWFGKTKRGLILGIWNCHTSVGNILGSVLAADALRFGWGWSFMLPAAFMAVIGILVYAFLPVEPEEVELPSPYLVRRLSHGVPRATTGGNSSYKPVLQEQSPSQQGGQHQQQQPLIAAPPGLGVAAIEPARDHGISFWAAWAIPGVAVYAFSLFFAKLVAYTFLYWLPYYIHVTKIGGEVLSPSDAGRLSTVFDIGGALGGVLAGFLSDKFQAHSITAASMVFLSVPALFVYSTFGSVSLLVNGALMFVAGIFVNGPYALITTAVSADLGTHKSLEGNEKALATVTAIIDGTGSLGAALGPLITGFLSQESWTLVFYMLYTSALISGLLLTGLVADEIRGRLTSYRGMSVYGLDQLVPPDPDEEEALVKPAVQRPVSSAAGAASVSS